MTSTLSRAGCLLDVGHSHAVESRDCAQAAIASLYHVNAVSRSNCRRYDDASGCDSRRCERNDRYLHSGLAGHEERGLGLCGTRNDGSGSQVERIDFLAASFQGRRREPGLEPVPHQRRQGPSLATRPAAG